MGQSEVQNLSNIKQDSLAVVTVQMSGHTCVASVGYKCFVYGNGKPGY